MTKSELIAALTADNPQLTPQHVEAVVNTIFDQIRLALVEKKRVELRGFGIFSIRPRNTLMTWNPQTGLPVPVRYKNVPFFKPGKYLRKRIRDGAAVTQIDRKLHA